MGWDGKGRGGREYLTFLSFRSFLSLLSFRSFHSFCSFFSFHSFTFFPFFLFFPSLLSLSSFPPFLLSPVPCPLYPVPTDDVDSLERTCSPPGASAACTPGCTHPRDSKAWPARVVWCSSTQREAVDDEWPCAWRPTDTRSMLVQREALREAEPWFKPFHKRFDDHKFYVSRPSATPATLPRFCARPLQNSAPLELTLLFSARPRPLSLSPPGRNDLCVPLAPVDARTSCLFSVPSFHA